MSRVRLDYAAQRDLATCANGFDPNTPIAGLYRFRLRSGGMPVAVRIWFGQPIEPWTGELMDRAPRWNATINGQWAEVERVWPYCADKPIDEAEAAHLMALQRWGAEHGHAAIADPRKRIDFNTLPLPF